MYTQGSPLPDLPVMRGLDLDYCMGRCIELARGSTYAGVRKGAVVISADGMIVGEGQNSKITLKYSRHAERAALEQADDGLTNRARGGTLVTTIEPCVQVRPDQVFDSCVQVIIRSGIARVVYGLVDTNPLINGRGLRALLDARVEVVCYPDRNHEIADLLSVRARAAFDARYSP